MQRPSHVYNLHEAICAENEDKGKQNSLLIFEADLMRKLGIACVNSSPVTLTPSEVNNGIRLRVFLLIHSVLRANMRCM